MIAVSQEFWRSIIALLRLDKVTVSGCLSVFDASASGRTGLWDVGLQDVG